MRVAFLAQEGWEVIWPGMGGVHWWTECETLIASEDLTGLRT